MALRLQSKFRDHFSIQTSPPNPQKDTLGSRIGPQKTSKLFPHHFYCWRQKKLDNSKLGSTQQQKICWHWHVARIISLQKIYGLYARKHHIVEMRGDVTDAGRTTEQLKIELLSQWKLEAESRKNSVLIRFSDFSVWGNCIKGANDMKQNNLILQLYWGSQLQFRCNKCNFTLVKLNTFKTHMKKR